MIENIESNLSTNQKSKPADFIDVDKEDTPGVGVQDTSFRVE